MAAIIENTLLLQHRFNISRCPPSPFPTTLVLFNYCAELMLGLGDSTELLTNADILELLHPTSPKVTYLYDGFDKWGSCTDWDACPECTDAVEGR